MSRQTVLNLVLGALALSLVGGFLYLSSTDADSATTTTTSSSTTTTTTIPPTTIPPTTTTTTSTTTTTLPPTTLPPTTLPPPERALVPVVVTSAGLDGDRVGPNVYLLSLQGWSDIRGVNGAVRIPTTTIYFADGFQNAAELLAFDMSLPPTVVAPLASIPPVAGLGSAQLVVYLGDA